MAGFPTDINSEHRMSRESSRRLIDVAARGVGRPISTISVVGDGET